MLRTQWPVPQSGGLNIPNVLGFCETVKGHDTHPTKTHRKKKTILEKLSVPVERRPGYRKPACVYGSLY